MRNPLIIFLLLFVSAAHAQIIEPLGQSPPGIRWQQIQTPHFRIIFPAAITSDAERIANAMDNAYHDVAASLKSYPRKIPIVMQNQTTDNNAFVSSEGRRAEFYSTPPQNPNNMGMNNWYDELSLHEYRHVVQMDQTRRGWGKAVYFLFGNSGTSVMQGLTNPWWFWEGDAVGCESTMGYGGRGRIPSFDLTFRTQLLTRGPFPYNKAACGSLKNAIPNHYLLGYLMTTYAKNHFGADVWSKILTHTYTSAPLPFSFSHSMKKVTGLNAEAMYKAMTTEIKQLWQQQADSIEESAATIVGSPREKVFTNYKFPQYLPDGRIVVEKSGLETGSFLAYKSSIVDQSVFVVIDSTGHEKNIRLSGVLDDNGVLSEARDKIVWSEYSYDPRWGARNYTVIKVLDITTGKVKQLTHRSRLHAPCFSPDARTIAAIEYNTSNRVYVNILDAATGQLIKRYDNPKNELYLEPHFSQDGLRLIMVRAQQGAKSLVELTLSSGELHTLLAPVDENLSAPVDYDHYILYNSPRSGIDNIYAIDTLTGIKYMVTSRRYGAFNPCIAADGKTLVFQDFTVDGFRPATMPLTPGSWHVLVDETHPVEYFKPFQQQEAGNILSHIPDSVYKVSPYKKLGNAFKIYGWGVDPVTNLPDISIGIRSVDMLSTTTFDAGFRFDNNERHWGKYLRIGYEGWYPKLFFGYTDGRRRSIFSEGETDTTGVTYDLISYHNWNAGASLPLNFSGGPYIRKFTVTAQAVYTSLSTLLHAPSGKKFAHTDLGNLYTLQYDAIGEIRLRQSMRDVAPRLGTLVQFSYRNAPFHSNFHGEQTALDANLYLPGFARHHAFRFRYYWQQDAATNYHFENKYDFVRNQRSRLFNAFHLWSVDYKFPLCYPDLSVFHGMLYFQRIKAGAFAELAHGTSATQSRDYTNLGVEISSDVNIQRFLVPFDLGLRLSYDREQAQVHGGLILKVPIF